jgi:hypothetical protein
VKVIRMIEHDKYGLRTRMLVCLPVVARGVADWGE